MISRENEMATIAAYFLSKFDEAAVNALGFSSRQQAFDKIGDIVGAKSNYIKQRRDEFDVLTESHRRGYCKRKPTDYVVHMHQTLDPFTFDELKEKVCEILAKQNFYWPRRDPDGNMQKKPT